MLTAYRYQTRSGVPHLRCKQSHFSEAAKHRLHRVGSPARWMPAEQAWSWPLSAAAVIALDAAAKDLKEEIFWEGNLQEFADQHLKQAAIEHDVRLAIERIIRDGTPLEGYITRMARDNGEALLPARHQQVGYHWSQRVGGLLLAWSMGTGKTRAAADASGGWYRNGLIRPMTPTMFDGKPGVEGGVLVVCPKTMLRTWQDELSLWQSASSILIAGSANWKMRRAAMPTHYHVTNYESLKYVVHNRYDGLIIDEIHRAGHNTIQTNNVLGIAQNTRKRLGLSGTPISNSLESIFFPMLILDGGKTLGSSRTSFLEKYFYTINTNGGFVKHEAHADAENRIAAAMAESTFFVKKEEVLDLPPKTHTPIYLEMTDEQAKYYRQIREEAITYIQDATVTVEQASARMMKLLQICQGFALTDTLDAAGNRQGRHFTDAKTEALMDLLTGNLSNTKTVVWGFFQYEIQRLVNMLTERGVPFVRIDGTITSQRDRDAAQDRWNSDPTLRVYVRQMAMSEGVTLLGDKEVPCYNSIFLGLSYRMIDLLQAQDRIHRIGQKHRCNYVYLLTENGVDKRVYENLLTKSETASRVQQMGKDFYLSLLKDKA